MFSSILGIVKFISVQVFFIRKRSKSIKGNTPLLLNVVSRNKVGLLSYRK